MTQSNRERLRTPAAAQAGQRRINRIIGVGAAVLAVVLAAVLGLVIWQQAQQGSGGATVPPNAAKSLDAIVANPGKAKPGAPVVDLFFDYQCPVCKQFEDIFGGALNTLAQAGDIQLRYRTLTFMDNNLRNDSSTRSAVAAACADVAGQYEAYHATVFANQPTAEGVGYPTALLRDTIPGEIGLSGGALTTFQACYDQRATKGFVDGVDGLAAKAGVTSTPTLWVNGKLLPLEVLSRTAPADLGSVIRQHA